MATYYNTTNVTAANNIAEIYIAVNDLSGGLLSGIVLFVLAMIIFIIGKASGFDTKAVMLGDSFILSILAVLFWQLGAIGLNIVMYPLIFLLGSILVYVFWGN